MPFLQQSYCIYVLQIQNYIRHSNFKRFFLNQWTLLQSKLKTLNPTKRATARQIYGAIYLQSQKKKLAYGNDDLCKKDEIFLELFETNFATT